MDKILFASAHVDRLAAEASLPAKFQRLLKQADLGAKFEGKRVAVKMHVGGHLGFYTIHPLFVKILVDALKAAGARPFLVDGSYSVEAAIVRGYTPEVVGARVVGAGGEMDRYIYRRKTAVPGLPTIELCGNIVDADALLVFSHGKGHGCSGFGGAIKNIAMGCVSCRTRGAIHGLMGEHYTWDAELCTHCGQCVSSCPTGAASFNKEGEFGINAHHCRYCGHCVTACPKRALTMQEGLGETTFTAFQTGMAAACKAVLAEFDASSVHYVTALMNITPLCDCWGFSTPPLVPDVGIISGDNLVSIEQAALDMIDWRKLILENVPDQLCPPGKKGHLFQRIHGKDPYVQVRQCEALGLGEKKYKILEVK